MHSVCVDFNSVQGKIKPMHAVNNMPTVPFNTAADLYGKLRDAHA